MSVMNGPRGPRFALLFILLVAYGLVGGTLVWAAKVWLGGGWAVLVLFAVLFAYVVTLASQWFAGPPPKKRSDTP